MRGDEGEESVEGGGKGVCREWTNFCKAASGSGRLEIGLDNLLEISSSFLHLLVRRILVLFLILLNYVDPKSEFRSCIAIFVVCENQAFRSGWVRLPVEVSAGGVRWEDIPEQCSLTWCKLQSQFFNALWAELSAQLVNQICQQSLSFYPHPN